MTALPFSTQAVLEQVSRRLRAIQQEMELLEQQELMAAKFSRPEIWRSVLETPPPSASERLRRLSREQEELRQFSETLFTQF